MDLVKEIIAFGKPILIRRCKGRPGLAPGFANCAPRFVRSRHWFFRGSPGRPPARLWDAL